MALIGRLDVIVLYYGSLITLYPLLNRLRTYGQHVWLNLDGTATLAGSHISRTTDCGFVDRIVFTSPRLLYHDDHHRYPFLPWRALVELDEPSTDVNHRVTHRWSMLRAVVSAGLPALTWAGAPAQVPKTCCRVAGTGWSSCSYVHDSGVRSSRQRWNRAVCRNRSPCMCS